MTAAELIAHLRKNILRDNAEPVLWSDDELALYFNEAEKLFARHTHCIVEEDSSLALLYAIAGIHTYPLDKRIVHVYGITNSDGRSLSSKSRNQLPKVFGNGRPVAFTTGRGSSTVRLSPTPDADEELTMLVAVTPDSDFATSGYEPGIPEEYHLSLCSYAAYKALVNNDPEGSNTEAAGNFYQQWKEALRDAKRDVFRLRVPEGSTVRNNWTAARRG